MAFISEKFMLRVLLAAVWSANTGLLGVLFGMKEKMWYLYVLGAVWPAQAVMGLAVLFVGEEVNGKVTDNGGKSKRPEKERAD